MGNLVTGFVIGFLAALAGWTLGLEWGVAWSLWAVPVAFSFSSWLRGMIFSTFLAFAIGTFVWAWTPLPDAIDSLINRWEAAD